VAPSKTITNLSVRLSRSSSLYAFIASIAIAIEGSQEPYLEPSAGANKRKKSNHYVSKVCFFPHSLWVKVAHLAHSLSLSSIAEPLISLPRYGKSGPGLFDILPTKVAVCSDGPKAVKEIIGKERLTIVSKVRPSRNGIPKTKEVCTKQMESAITGGGDCRHGYSCAIRFNKLKCFM